MTERTIVIEFSSHLTDEEWAQARGSLEEELEQWACDTAASVKDDSYRVYFA